MGLDIHVGRIKVAQKAALDELVHTVGSAEITDDRSMSD
jgi:hypothetical protein